MKKIMLLFVALIANKAIAETVTLALPGKASLSFDAPQMAKVKEVTEGEIFQYFASSIGTPDPRFNLSVYVEPINCHFGESLKEVTRCFLEHSDLRPGIIKESRGTRCDERRCEVTYVTDVKTETSGVVQVHTNTVFVYRRLWVDVHFSVISSATADKAEDGRIFDRLAKSLALVVKPSK